jgi:RNA polymerase sigma factor FliA
MARMPRAVNARDALIEENIGLVVHIAHRIAGRLPSERDRDELVAAGMVGLVEAATRFDPERGMPFSSFAGLRIEGAILDTLRQSDRLPRAVRTLQRRIEQTETMLTARLRRTPTSAEVAEACEMTCEDLHTARLHIASGGVDSLDRTTTDERVRVADLLADTAVLVDDQVADRDAADAVRAAIAHLSERHRFVIIGCMFEGRPLRDLAVALGVTRSRVSQLKEEAIRQLRAILAEQGTIDLTGTTLPRPNGRRVANPTPRELTLV